MRHPWLASYVPDIDALAARDVLGSSVPDNVVVGVVPAFVWAEATSCHGSKGVAGRLMPYRADWLVLGMSLTTRAGVARGPGRVLEAEADPEPVTAGEVRERATAARWHLFEEMSRWAPRAIAAAHIMRCDEVAESRGRPAEPLLDALHLEALADGLMLAENGFFERMLRLVVRPRCFDRVDPQRWIRMMLRREAAQAVSRAVGDVLPGPRIRRIAAIREHGPVDLDQLVERYNARVSRSNRVAAGRAARALLVGNVTPAAPASWEQLAEHLLTEPSAEDAFLGAEG